MPRALFEERARCFPALGEEAAAEVEAAGIAGVAEADGTVAVVAVAAGVVAAAEGVAEDGLMEKLSFAVGVGADQHYVAFPRETQKRSHRKHER